MDPKVCGKTLHRRGYGVDVEALHDQFPLRWSAGKGPKMGSHGYKKVAAMEIGFRGAPRCFQGMWIYIGKGSQSGEPRGAHKGGGRPPPQGHASLPRRFLVCYLTSTPCLLDCVCSKNNSPEGFIPFGLRLIFLFFETLK